MNTDDKTLQMNDAALEDVNGGSTGGAYAETGGDILAVYIPFYKPNIPNIPCT